MSNAQARAWIEVNASALRANFETIRARVGARTAILPMVKADGYGLGAAWVVRQLDPFKPWGYGVAAVSEGTALRAAGVRRPIVVFSPLTSQALAEAAHERLSIALSDLASLQRWAGLAEQSEFLDFHLEIDTGMGRAGFDWRETGVWSPAVRAFCSQHLRWTGVYTHFQGADAAERATTATQWERFHDAIAQLPVSRENLMVHAANSAAALRWPEFAADAVRPGIFLYGGHPARNRPEVPAPQAVAAVRARVVLVRSVPPGTSVGYGATHAARAPETWATIGIGYGDGLPRSLSNRGQAIVRGNRVKVIGRISMDLTVVDVTGVPGVQAGDEVTFIGRDGDEEITVDDVAAQAETISYEILTGLTPRLPRLERANG
ncbi:MAG: alanine racemase [Longimicrobiales bacterium]